MGKYPDKLSEDQARQAEARAETDLGVMRAFGGDPDGPTDPLLPDDWHVSRDAASAKRARHCLREAFGWEVDIGDTCGPRTPWYDVEPLGAETLISQVDEEPITFGVTAQSEELATARLILVGYTKGVL